jgi:hypothetical protein
MLEEKVNRSMSMPPEVWGPIFWATIHIIALAYPDSPNYGQKRAAKEFFQSLVELIPCPVCRVHYADNLKSFPIEPHLDTRSDLIDWTLKLHNRVNLATGKPTYTRDQFLKAYEEMSDKGLPVPPSKFSKNLFESADEKSYQRGIITGVIATLGLVGVTAAVYKSYAMS